jgi:diguanylate cyclase (GGDEF)-like protein
MGMRTSNDVGLAFLEARSGAQDAADYDARADDAFAASASLRLELAATERRFAAALRELEKMRRRDAFNEEKVALLEEAAAKAQRFAYRDELTGLPNRHLLLDRFNQAAALAARHDKNVALLFLDLDRFKEINSTLGHSAGDELLRQIALRLVGGIRMSDTACRYGGDEFVVLLAEIGGKEGAFVVANNLRVHLAAPYLIDGASITITTSVGIAVYPDDARGYGDLIQASDLAMYRHKARRPPVPRIVDATLLDRSQDGGAPSLLDRRAPSQR